MKLALATCFAFLPLSGCYHLQSMSVPIAHERYAPPEADKPDDKKPRRLMVLLPGMGDRASAFDKHGFIRSLQQSRPDFDVVTVESHFKYYQSTTIVERLHKDIILPAIASGYQEIYIGGISLGGLGALLYLREHPDEVSGIFVLAPYLGEKGEYQYLLDGSARNEKKITTDLWPWLSELPAAHKNKIHLAYGASDRFSEANDLLATYLPEDHIVKTPGKHLWTTWKLLWPELLCKRFSC
ncbi:MAG: hypothetical protein COA42_18810 [Alteromonadaceae bacterium]|nr:MAG: hypothetical protein COA42_18810 [Alteromonadaceae bacterium]